MTLLGSDDAPALIVSVPPPIVSVASFVRSISSTRNEWPGLIEQSGLSGGIVVALDVSDGKSIADLALTDRFVVHGLLPTEPGVEKARSEIKETGLYGRVSCDLYNGRDLPYIDNLVNLLLCKSSCKTPRPELMRVIVPGGLLMEQEPGGWKTPVPSSGA